MNTFILYKVQILTRDVSCIMIGTLHIGSHQKESNSLKDTTFGCLLPFHLQGGHGSSLEHFPDALIVLGAALKVGEGVDLLCHSATLCRRHKLLVHLPQFLDPVWIVSKILECVI